MRACVRARARVCVCVRVTCDYIYCLLELNMTYYPGGGADGVRTGSASCCPLPHLSPPPRPRQRQQRQLLDRFLFIFATVFIRPFFLL